jgi:peptidoglycan/xylan/chitin deacetylase (PgdA/CDA1 family)
LQVFKFFLNCNTVLFEPSPDSRLKTVFTPVFAIGLLAAALSSTSCTTTKGKKSAPTTAAPTGDASGAAGLPSSSGLRDSYNRVETNLPYLALTFDDGPHPAHTPRLLDILKAKNVKATFYVIATNAKRYPEIMRRIVAEGHEIGNHSVTHGNLSKMSADGVRNELRVCHEAIVATTGVAPRTMRPPYGAITSAQKSWIKKEFGYSTILWSVDPLDWKKPGASVVASRLVSGAAPGGILLAHDIHGGTIDAMPSTIDQLLGRGFKFATVTQLLAMEPKG